jgi:cysteine desulfuration protein SufE
VTGERPPKLQDVIDNLALMGDRNDRIEMLISLAGRYQEVSPEVAERPFDDAHKVPACESEAYAWVTDNPDGTLGLHFAVENPQGISAMAMAAILDRGLSGEPPEVVARVRPEVIYDIFGRELSMGKSMGLMGMVTMVQQEAERRLGAR